MAKPKFPNLIHVIQGELEPGETFLQVLDDGVVDESIDSTKPCAIYKLVKAGRVQVDRRFVEGK